MSLSEYWQKRNFYKTMEPSGDITLDEKDSKYVVQKHHSLHLHYDLRLEREGVLKSWAVPKEPPVKRGIKRLAIQTEDHPVD